MVAQTYRETFEPTSHMPAPIPSDSDEVRLALESAQAFHAIGKMGEAIEWLERAADRAEDAGQRERALVLIQATAPLMNHCAPTSSRDQTPASTPPSAVRDRGSVGQVPTALPPLPPPLRTSLSSLPPPARTSSILPPPPRKSRPPLARKSSLPPAPALLPAAAHDASPPKGPPRASVPPKRFTRAATLIAAAACSSSRPESPASASSGAAGRAPIATVPAIIAVDAPPEEHTARVNTIRVAIGRSVPEIGSFTIERLAKGQPLPAGTKEATLVLSEDVD